MQVKRVLERTYGGRLPAFDTSVPVAEGREGPAPLGRCHGVDIEGPHRDQGVEGPTDPGGVVPSAVQLLHLVGVEALCFSPTT